MEEKPADFDWFDQTGSRSVSLFFGGDGMVGAGFLSLALLLASPRFAHGGSLAALIDETFSKLLACLERGAINIKFQHQVQKLSMGYFLAIQ